MKTSVIMTRRMGQFNVLQRTKDGMFNATALLAQWNRTTGDKKEITKFFENQATKQFIEALMEEENLHTQNSAYVKSRASRGDNSGTWMHPYLFVKFAMWLNPRFEVKVVKFVYDELIKFRTTAGDNYNVLARSIAALPDVDYSQVARGLNWIIFDKHERDIRNTATPKQLQALDDLQRKLAFSVDMGYIRTFPDLMNSMRKIYSRQYAKF